MKFFAFLLSLFLLLNASYAESSFAKSGYNSDAAAVESIKEVDGAVGFFACVGCHNGKATYALIMKNGEDFKLSYYGISKPKAKLKSADKEFVLNKEEALALMDFLGYEISRAKEESSHVEGKKRGSSFEFAIKEGDKWAVAGSYSKDSTDFVKKFSTIIKAKDEVDFSAKIKQVKARN